MAHFLSTLVPEPWKELSERIQNNPDFLALSGFLEEAYAHSVVYPPKDLIFAALDACPPESVRCILLGQDPYHGPGQAHGLSFSVSSSTKIPPSLRNIFKEYHSDLSLPIPSNGNLMRWANQGVLLLNTVLTVEDGTPGSHAKRGWEEVTRFIVQMVLDKSPNAGFLCFGNPARNLASKIMEECRANNSFIVAVPHPSPLSAYRGFFGSKPFTRFNEERIKRGLEIVPWELPSSGQQSMF